MRLAPAAPLKGSMGGEGGREGETWIALWRELRPRLKREKRSPVADSGDGDSDRP